MNAPIIEHRHDHRPEFLKRVLPYAVEQLRPSHMAHGSALDLLLLFGGKIERVAQENVCIPLVTRIAGHDGIKSFSKSNFLHGSKRVICACYDKQQAPREQLR